MSASNLPQAGLATGLLPSSGKVSNIVQTLCRCPHVQQDGSNFVQNDGKVWVCVFSVNESCQLW